MGKNHNRASLALHAFVDNLDNAHYDANNGKLEYNLGEVIQNGFFSNVDIVIIQGNSESIRAAKRKDSDTYAIVIQTPTLPEIGAVDDFIENKKIAIPVIKELAKIANNLEDQGVDGSDQLTDHEKSKKFNSKDFFEKAYMLGVEKMNRYLERLQGQIESLNRKAENAGLASRKATYKMAIDKLKEETIGEDAKKFSTKFYELIEEEHPNFRKYLETENRKRLESRVNQFYKKISSRFKI